jgi:DNA polymerase-3 subunit gamma/tau
VTRQIEKNEKRRLYTSVEKYQALVEKNPALEDFKRRFNLSVE